MIYDDKYLELYGGKDYGSHGNKRKEWEFKRRYSILGGNKILDAGFGGGMFLKACPKGTNCIGIDVNKAAVKELNNEGLEVYNSTVTDIPFENESFDGIHCAQVIEHLSIHEVDDMMDEFHRILMPEGRLIITTPHIKNVWDSPEHVRPYTTKAMKKLFARKGFKFLNGQNLGKFRGLGRIPQPLYYYVQRITGRIFTDSLLVVGEVEK